MQLTVYNPDIVYNALKRYLAAQHNRQQLLRVIRIPTMTLWISDGYSERIGIHF